MDTYSVMLRALRKNRGLSQSQLAEELGISKSSVSMYEQGNREPDLTLLKKIADFFEVETDYLLGRNFSSNGVPITIAAHLDTSDLTQKELDDVADYIAFIRSKRKR